MNLYSAFSMNAQYSAELWVQGQGEGDAVARPLRSGSVEKQRNQR
jgi:hypothetical protein